jgi:hypothetical protein
MLLKNNYTTNLTEKKNCTNLFSHDFDNFDKKNNIHKNKYIVINQI